MFTIARNLWVNWIRDQEPTVPLPQGLPELEYCAFIEPNINVVIAVQEAVKKLSDEDQRIINLYHLDDVERTWEEIAVILNENPGTCKTRCCRARKRLEHLLKDDPRITKCVLQQKRAMEEPTND
jgi:DNA-directed RNA polymerase specialized sigma24 family protein